MTTVFMIVGLSILFSPFSLRDSFIDAATTALLCGLV